MYSSYTDQTLEEKRKAFGWDTLVGRQSTSKEQRN